MEANPAAIGRFLPCKLEFLNLLFLGGRLPALFIFISQFLFLTTHQSPTYLTQIILTQNSRPLFVMKSVCFEGYDIKSPAILKTSLAKENFPILMIKNYQKYTGSVGNANNSSYDSSRKSRFSERNIEDNTRARSLRVIVLTKFNERHRSTMYGFSSYTLFLIFFALTETSASEIYTNVWAVKMNGGQSEVERLALKYDLSYDKHVSTTWLYAPVSQRSWVQIPSGPIYNYSFQ